MANKQDFVTALKTVRYCRTKQELEHRGNTLAYLWQQLKPQQRAAIINEKPLARVWYAAWSAAKQTA